MDTNDTQDVVTEEVVEETEEGTDTTEDTTEETKAEKPTETLEQKEARLARQLEQTRKKLGKDGEEKVETPKAKTGKFDDTTLDYLDLKGVTESEDIKVVQDVATKTGMTVREVLKDEYVVAKLDANRKARELKAATPSSTKRGDGQTSDSLAAAIAKFDATQKLPEDFELRTKVVNAIADRSSGNKPRWH